MSEEKSKVNFVVCCKFLLQIKFYRKKKKVVHLTVAVIKFAPAGN